MECSSNLRSRSSNISSSTLLPYTNSNTINQTADNRKRACFIAMSKLIYPLYNNIQKLHNQTMQRSSSYNYLCHKLQPYLHTMYKVLIKLLSLLKDNNMITKSSTKQRLFTLLLFTIYTSCYIYYIKIPLWEYEKEWHEWETKMQNSVSELIPPPLDIPSYGIELDGEWDANILQQFPYLMSGDKQQEEDDHAATNNDKMKKVQGRSEYVVPIPDYEMMGITREKLAMRLHKHAIQSCQMSKEQPQPKKKKKQYPIPVIGITVANDTPTNRYLRRILHTIDLDTVGSIVVTWYDEQTEAQIVGQTKQGLSHYTVEESLKEYIVRKGFKEIARDDRVEEDDNVTSKDLLEDDEDESIVQLADTKSLKVLSRVTTSIQQFCIHEKTTNQKSMKKKGQSCRNELIILRFSTNLGCSSGVNNPLFTHPTAPHWLIANYDIAYPPGVLNAMAVEVQKAKRHYPNLAVHTYGYIYGRGKIENPWSNFIMTSCAVANVGVWDENIFPAYYEDDDYRDRIRYSLGEWMDVISDPDKRSRRSSGKGLPQKLMNDTHLIRYQTDRNVSVVHGPINASTYLSGTHETLQKQHDKEMNRSYLKSLWLWLTRSNTKESPYHYESERWRLAKEVSHAEGFFRCKHGAIPDAGEHGEDSLRYFGYDERFILPFVNSTRVTSHVQEDRTLPVHLNVGYDTIGNNPSPWAAWSFNATRRKCVHTAINVLLTMKPSKEKTNLTKYYKGLCSVC